MERLQERFKDGAGVVHPAGERVSAREIELRLLHARIRDGVGGGFGLLLHSIGGLFGSGKRVSWMYLLLSASIRRLVASQTLALRNSTRQSWISAKQWI